MEGLMIHAIESGVSFLVIFIFVALIFFSIKFIYYGKEKCDNRFFNSYIPMIAFTILIKIFSYRILYFYHTEPADFFWFCFCSFLFIIFILTILAKLLFRGIPTNLPTKNTPLVRFFKVAHICFLLLDLTIAGAFIGIPAFFILWILQYIFMDEKHPFFAFKRYKPKEIPIVSFQ